MTNVGAAERPEPEKFSAVPVPANSTWPPVHLVDHVAVASFDGLFRFLRIEPPRDADLSERDVALAEAAAEWASGVAPRPRLYGERARAPRADDPQAVVLIGQTLERRLAEERAESITTGCRNG